MKHQYLGDSKDSFKWDYHDFLVNALGWKHFQIVGMMTPDDGGRDGRTSPENFPAGAGVLRFCNSLRESRDLKDLLKLPGITGSRYNVSLYKSEDFLDGDSRDLYFSGIERQPERLLFLDPDNGFEPEGSLSEKHVSYFEVDKLMAAISPTSAISVFQHHRRIKFGDDFARIRQRLRGGFSTAVCWNLLMFVIVSSSKETIRRVVEANREYAKNKPVRILA